MREEYSQLWLAGGKKSGTERECFHIQASLHFEEKRRRILIGLNKGEALHALARQRFFGRLVELRGRALEDQMHRASCLHLLMAAIAAWNTIYLSTSKRAVRLFHQIPSSPRFGCPY